MNISTESSMDDVIPVNAKTEQIESKHMSIFGHYKRWYGKYIESFRQTILRVAVKEIHDAGKSEISISLKIPMFLAWLNSWGPMNLNSHVGNRLGL